MKNPPPQRVEVSGAKAALGIDPLWAGQTIAGLQLAGTWRLETDSGFDSSTRTWATKNVAVMLVYGPTDPNAPVPGQVGVPDPTTPYVSISESPTLFEGFQRGVSKYSPPEGSLLIIGGRIGQMQKNGLHIALEASNEQTLIAAAQALEPMGS
jgi:hypothetical protein